jgi:hypothetical protein
MATDNEAAEIDCALKNAILVPDGCCCLTGKGNERSSSESTSHHHLQRLMDWTREDNDLASQVTRPHTNQLLPIGPHQSPDLQIASWFWRGSFCPYCWGSSNHQADTWHFWTHISLYLVIVGCVSRLVAVHLNTCSKLVRNTTFFRILQWFCLMSNLSQTQFDSPQCCKDTSLTYSCLTNYLCFGRLYHLTKFGHEVFLHPVDLALQQQRKINVCFLAGLFPLTLQLEYSIKKFMWKGYKIAIWKQICHKFSQRQQCETENIQTHSTKWQHSLLLRMKNTLHSQKHKWG